MQHMVGPWSKGPLQLRLLNKAMLILQGSRTGRCVPSKDPNAIAAHWPELGNESRL